MWINKPFYKYATAAILILIIIYLLGKIDYFMWPFQKLIITIFFPILIAGLLYYILRPVVHFFSKYMPLTLSILLLYAVIGGIGYSAVHFLGPKIASQSEELIHKIPDKLEKITSESKNMLNENTSNFLSADKFLQYAKEYTDSFPKLLSDHAVTIFSTISSIITVLLIVPFIVFYFLKDGHKLKPFLLKHIPSNVEAEGNRILMDVDKTLSTYIVGQFIIAVVDGFLMYIGYLIIGLDNALILAIFATLLTVVPFLGPFLGTIPALISALLISPFTALKVLILLAIVQQLEGHLVTPQVMGRRLDIHPLTVILLLLVAGSLYGFIGILIAIPTYSVVKVIVQNFIKFYKLRTT
jgi:predicted PurR-regulated permease PerM